MFAFIHTCTLVDQSSKHARSHTHNTYTVSMLQIVVFILSYHNLKIYDIYIHICITLLLATPTGYQVVIT